MSLAPGTSHQARCTTHCAPHSAQCTTHQARVESVDDGPRSPHRRRRAVGAGDGYRRGAGGLDYTVVEKGVLVNSIYQFPVHMTFFTTPELLEIGGVPLVTPYEKPTRIEALRYYRRVAEKFNLGIEFGRQVTGLERDAATGVLTVTSTYVGGDENGPRARRRALPSDTTTTRTGWAWPARICPTSRTTTATPTRATGNAW